MIEVLAISIALLVAVRVWMAPPRAFALCLGLNAYAGLAASVSGMLRTAPLVKFVCALIVCMGIAKTLARPERSASLTQRCPLALLLLMAYAFGSLLWMPSPSQGVEIWARTAPYLLVCCLGAWVLLRSRQDFDGAVSELLFLGVPVLAIALAFGDWGRRGLVVSTLMGRETGGEAGALELATLAGACSLASTGRLATAAGLTKLTLQVSVVVMVALMLRTGSRGQVVALIATVLIGQLCNRQGQSRVRSTAIGAAVAISLAAYFGWGILDPDIQDRWSVTEIMRGAGAREQKIDILWTQFESLPTLEYLIGLGSGFSSLVRGGGIYPHNVPFEVLCELGLVGLSLLIVCYSASRKRTRVPDQCDADIAGVQPLIIYYTLISLKQGYFIGSYSLLALLAIRFARESCRSVALNAGSVAVWRGAR